MANQSLTAQPFSRNAVYLFADVLEAAFQYYTSPQHYSPMVKDYACALRTVVGLAFTAVLVDGALVVCYEDYLKRFIQWGDFEQHTQAHRRVAQAVGEMLVTAIPVFRYLGYPRYFDSFKASLRYLLTAQVMTTVGKQAIADTLLAALQAYGI